MGTSLKPRLKQVSSASTALVHYASSKVVTEDEVEDRMNDGTAIGLSQERGIKPRIICIHYDFHAVMWIIYLHSFILSDDNPNEMSAPLKYYLKCYLAMIKRKAM